MTTWWIGAIPRKDDPVWDVSSEKIPHLTILYLGDSNPEEDADRVAEYVKHAASMLRPFGLSVDRREVLGDDEADVLVFESAWVPEDLRDFRINLLRDSKIKAAYDSSPQYSKWKPHLTLGYPDKPAKKSDDRLSWVEFDTIAFWTDDYDGWEFPLRRGPDESLAIAQSNGKAFILEHHGVKGMKWGVRNDDSSNVSRSNQRPSTGSTERTEQIKSTAKLGLKLGAKAGARTLIIGGVVALGGPVLGAAAIAAATIAAYPGVTSAGRDYVKLALEEKGAIRMSAIDKTKAVLNIKKFEIQMRDKPPILEKKTVDRSRAGT
jgi:2'-5' RNA ligase